MNFDTYDFNGKKALVRVDFNVPLNDQLEITDDTRMQAAVPTMKKILADGGRLILMSHLGRPKNNEPEFSLRHLVNHLEHLLSTPVKFADNCVGDDALDLTSGMQNGEVVLLENLRYHKEETAGDEFFAGQLAEHADVYVNDAFGTAHRAHASTAIIARFFPHDKLFGKIMEGEITAIDKVLHDSEKPVTAIIGGAKVSSKISIIENLLGRMDHILIGGGMAFTFIKAQGGNVGSSLTEDDKMELALDILKAAKEKGTQIHLPTDAIAADAFNNEANRQTCAIGEIPDGWMGLDIGPDSVEQYKQVIENSKTILWNGPMGVFEMENFAQGTVAVAKKLAEVTQTGTFTLIGGGDSVAAINQFNLADQVSYVSTGGGAMLEYLEGKVLPGIAAVRE
ncbi:MAG: phosphoglycerate kinase [Flavobacteriales bacterium]|nr:phosphoglycerate kinase [Flavobacteriales bacterium]